MSGQCLFGRTWAHKTFIFCSFFFIFYEFLYFDITMSGQCLFGRTWAHKTLFFAVASLFFMNFYILFNFCSAWNHLRPDGGVVKENCKQLASTRPRARTHVIQIWGMNTSSSYFLSLNFVNYNHHFSQFSPNRSNVNEIMKYFLLLFLFQMFQFRNITK